MDSQVPIHTILITDPFVSSPSRPSPAQVVILNIVYGVEQESVQQLQMICSNKFVRIEQNGSVHANDASDHPREYILVVICFAWKLLSLQHERLVSSNLEGEAERQGGREALQANPKSV